MVLQPACSALQFATGRTFMYVFVVVFLGVIGMWECQDLSPGVLQGGCQYNWQVLLIGCNGVGLAPRAKLD